MIRRTPSETRAYAEGFRAAIEAIQKYDDLALGLLVAEAASRILTLSEESDTVEPTAVNHSGQALGLLGGVGPAVQ